MLYGYIRTSLHQSDDRRSINADNQILALQQAGVAPSQIHQDLGISGAVSIWQRPAWARLYAQLQAGDTVVVAALDRLGRSCLDTMSCLSTLTRHQIRIRSLADTEDFVRHLDADPDSPEWMIAQIIATVMAWAAQQERTAMVRRTKAGMERARQEGQRLGRPPSLTPDQQEELLRLRVAGWSQQRLAHRYGISTSTVRRLAGGGLTSKT